MLDAPPLPLLDLPEPSLLRLMSSAGQTVVCFGDKVLFCYAGDDIGMRNMAVVALTDAGVRGKDVAAVFGLSAEYVSMLRGRARAEGSAGLVRRRGRPPKLGARQIAKARGWAAEGLTQTEIARRLSVSRPVIGELLSRLGPAPRQLALTDAPTGDAAAVPEAAVPQDAGPVAVSEDAGLVAVSEDAGPVAAPEDAAPMAAGLADPAGAATVGGARIGEGSFTSRYAGVMLLHPFLDRVGAAGVLSGACGRGARRYDDLGVLTATCLTFALGTCTVEASKHLVRTQVGPAAGIAALPELRTLRPRLAALAEGADPLGLQRRLAAAMLAADAPGLGLYFVDDHFVPYAGAKPVPKGYNTKRRHAGRGRDDTVVTDYHGRAVCFASGDPSGLSVTLPPALAQLRDVLGRDAKIMLGFDRGGSYPVVFAACRDAGAHWLTWRRGQLAPVTAAPVRSFRVGPGGACETITLADDMVEINGYGPARQLTLFEHDAPVLQILTSDLTAPAAALLAWLRCRWRIENTFKYLSAHHGIDSLADYHADITPTPPRSPTRPGSPPVNISPPRKPSWPAPNAPWPSCWDPRSTTPRSTPRSPAPKPGSPPPAPPWPPRKPNATPTPRNYPRTSSTPTRNGRGCAPTAAPCRWCYGCWPTTPNAGWPPRSTPTCKTPTSTGRSPATCSTSAAPSPTPPTRSP